MHDFALSTPTYSLTVEKENSTPLILENNDNIPKTAVYGAFGFEEKKYQNLFSTSELIFSNPLSSPLMAKNNLDKLNQLIEKTSLVPTDEEYTLKLSELVNYLQTSSIKKVVLSRKQMLKLKKSLNPDYLLTKLLANYAAANVFMQNNFSEKSILFGASPELVIRKQGLKISAYPLAGTIKRDTDYEIDKKNSLDLLSSAKDLTEHSYLTEHYRKVLTPLCKELNIPEHPNLVETKYAWHLGTPIQGELKTDITSLQLALWLHPTPAIGGFPHNQKILNLIKEFESTPRRFYGGNIGWQDQNGNGEWFLTIRCGEYFPQKKTIETWAGGGIIAASSPEAETNETKIKFKTISKLFEA